MNLSKIVLTTVAVIGTATLAGCISSAINKKVEELAAELDEESSNSDSE